MKIIKKKEVVTEEINVEIKTYYFEHQLVLYKLSFQEEDNYTMETLNNFVGIKIKEYEEWDYEFEAYLLGEEGCREISEEEYNLEREDIIKKLVY